MIETVKMEEHEDGSATYTFDMTEDAANVCTEVGLKVLLYCGILKKSPEYVFEVLSAEIYNMFKVNEDA